MSNKLLLTAIALGLWANALASWVRPAHADASAIEVSGIVSAINDVSQELSRINYGLHSIDFCAGRR